MIPLLNLSSTNIGSYRSDEILDEGGIIHKDDMKENKNSQVSDDSMEHKENDNVEKEHEQSEDDFVDLLNLSLSFDEDSSTSEEYDVSAVPSYQDLLGHERNNRIFGSFIST